MRLSVLFTAFVMAFGLLTADAADVGIWPKSAAAPATAIRVIPRSPAASLVWASDACWRGCAMDCGRQFQTCLSADAASNCIAQNDACDRFCQLECRLYGGPLLPLE